MAAELGGDDGGAWTELGIGWEWRWVSGRAEHLGVDANGEGRWAKGEEEATLEMGFIGRF